MNKTKVLTTIGGAIVLIVIAFVVGFLVKTATPATTEGAGGYVAEPQTIDAVGTTGTTTLYLVPGNASTTALTIDTRNSDEVHFDLSLIAASNTSPVITWEYQFSNGTSSTDLTAKWTNEVTQINTAASTTNTMTQEVFRTHMWNIGTTSTAYWGLHFQLNNFYSRFVRINLAAPTTNGAVAISLKAIPKKGL